MVALYHRVSAYKVLRRTTYISSRRIQRTMERKRLQLTYYKRSCHNMGPLIHEHNESGYHTALAYTGRREHLPGKEDRVGNRESGEGDYCT